MKTKKKDKGNKEKGKMGKRKKDSKVKKENENKEEVVEKSGKKLKEVEFKMRFNPGTQKYEPVLPLRKKEKCEKIVKISWFWIILLVVLVLILIGLVFVL